MRQTNLIKRLSSAQALLGAVPPCRLEGRVAGVAGLSAELAGLSHLLSIGDRVTLRGRGGREIDAEIVGFQGGRARVMAFAPLDGLGPGSQVTADPGPAGSAGTGGRLAVCQAWLGRVIDPLGRPLDGLGALPRGPASRPVR